MDLTEQKYLYYLDPFSLLNTSNLPWAASICVSECPSVEDLCEVTSLPCRNSTQYRCVFKPQSCIIFNLTAPASYHCQIKITCNVSETCCEPVVNHIHNSLSFLFCRCPYYSLTPGINATLADQAFGSDDTEYFDDLLTTSNTTCPAAAVQSCTASLLCDF